MNSSEQITSLFRAMTVNPKRVYEIIKGVSMRRTKDLGHISITDDGISLKSGALGQFQAVSFIPREFFSIYNFNGTEPIEFVIALRDLYGVLGITQDNDWRDQGDNDSEEFNQLEGSFYESELEGQERQMIMEGNDDNDDESNGFSDDREFKAKFEYEKVGATFNVELCDDTNSNIVEIVTLLQDPLYDIPEMSNKVVFFKISCYELKKILKDCLSTGSEVQLNGYTHDITILRFSSRNVCRFVEHNVRSEAFHQYRVFEDFQFTYSKNCIMPLLSLFVNKKDNIEVVIYTNGLMKAKVCLADVQHSYVNYIMMTLVENR